jgi:hypothetical protein
MGKQEECYVLPSFATDCNAFVPWRPVESRVDVTRDSFRVVFTEWDSAGQTRTDLVVVGRLSRGAPTA